MNYKLIILIILILILILRNDFKSSMKSIENFENKDLKLEYIHIPKTAGSSIEKLGKLYGLNWGMYSKRVEYEDKLKASNWHNYKFKPNKDFEYFTIVRNPYDRIISEYYYLRQFNKSYYDKFIDKTNKDKVKDIKNFKLFVKDIFEKYEKEGDKLINCHITPQSKFVYDKDNNKRIKHVIKMKNMNNELQNIFDNYNLNIDVSKMPKANITSKTFNKYDLDQETLDMIYNFYKRDFELLGYNKNIINIVTGYWEIENNKKHNIEHYKKSIINTASKLNHCNIYFYYNNNYYKTLFEQNINKTNKIIYIKRNINELPTYNISNKLLNLCKQQDNNKLTLLNKINEKGLVHYNREYKLSGEDVYKKIITIWTSKLYLIEETINNYLIDRIIWCDISISNLKNKYLNNGDFKTLYNSNKINITGNLMKYKGENLEIGACYIDSTTLNMLKFINLYKKQLNELNEYYCHDEETIMNIIYNSNKSLFNVIPL